MRPTTAPGRQLGRLALRQCRASILPASSPRFFSHTARRPRQQHQNDPYEQLRYARPLIEINVPRGQPHVPPPRSSRLFAAGCVAAAVAFYLLNTQTVPVTGRRRFNFLSDDVVIMSQGDAVGAIIAQVQEQGSRVLPDSDPRTQVVKRVMSRLIPVSGLKDLDWEIYVIDDDKTANAFVLPGGKVFVFSGILKICRNEDSVAAVLGHEIAHNVASHAAERLSLVSTGYLTGGCLFFLSGIWTGLTLFGGWALLGGYYLQELLLFLPADRKQEHEADCIGLMMMAEACYNPMAAVGFWQRMEAMSKAGGQEVPEMLSTHPSNEHRIANIQHWMPKALEKQAQSDCQVTAAFADKFRHALKKRKRVVHIDNL